MNFWPNAEKKSNGKAKVNNVVLDASAALAVLKREPGDDLVKSHLPGGLISAVNFAEVVGKLADIGLKQAEIHVAITALGLDVVPFDAQSAFLTGMLRRATQKKGLSLGDRACLALAKERNVIAVTADRNWADLDIGVGIRLIRGR